MTKQQYRNLLIKLFNGNEAFIEAAGLVTASKAYAELHFREQRVETPDSEEVRKQLKFIDETGIFKFDP